MSCGKEETTDGETGLASHKLCPGLCAQVFEEWTELEEPIMALREYYLTKKANQTDDED
jgi:hypothetical protein